MTASSEGTSSSQLGGDPVPAGKTLFDMADARAIPVPSSCRRNGRCHECVVEVTAGGSALAPPTEAESFLRSDYRLACQAVVIGDGEPICFEPLRTTPKILTESPGDDELAFDPVVSRCGDQVYYDGEVIDQYRGRLLGLAIDLGTTTIVMELIDLESAERIELTSFENPQRFGGSDVMHRISYDSGDPRGELRRAVVRAINHLIIDMERRIGFVRQQIYEVVIAGNSTMRDLFFKLDVQSIGQRPYKSTIELEYLEGARPHTALLERARRLGVRANPRARVYGLPLIASHVGADTAAAMLAVGLCEPSSAVRMLVDVGTNTEVVLTRGERVLVASCPAGPAFEGGGVSFGMRGYEGAIEWLRFADADPPVRYRTIGDLPPRGLCGSGLIDVLAELRRHGRMSAKGVFVDDRRRFAIDLIPEHGITFSKQDASLLAQAKAANFCGQLITMRAMGVSPADIDELYLAGGFANFVDVQSAVAIGFLAPVPSERVVKVGNAVIKGARQVLLSRLTRRALEQQVQHAEHIELETTPDFFEIFVEGCQLKPMPAVLDAGPAMG